MPSITTTLSVDSFASSIASSTSVDAEDHFQIAYRLLITVSNENTDDLVVSNWWFDNSNQTP